MAAQARCMQDSSRRQEIDLFSRQVSSELKAEYGEVAPPLRVSYLLSRLTGSAHIPSAHGAYRLSGYDHPQPNAQAAGLHEILLARGTWEGEAPLSDDELAALLAHELAHLEKQDLLRWGCFALAIEGGPGLGAADAVRSLLAEVEDPASAKRPKVQAYLHKLEYGADARAKELLSIAGFGSGGLASLLGRQSTGGPRSLTHPSSEQRVSSLADDVEQAR